MNLTRIALENRTTVFFLTIGLCLLGVAAYFTLPRESNPDVSIPYILVITPYPGAAPVDVERQVTQRIEKEIQGVSDLKSLRSVSLESLSTITAEFNSGIDVDTALQKVRDRVERARADLPTDAEDTQVQEINFSNLPVVQINLGGDVGPVVLKRLAEDLQDELEIVPGVLSVNLVGGVEREIQVDVDPQKLGLYHLTLEQVIGAIASENVGIPAGRLTVGSQAIGVRIPGEITDPLEVGGFVIKAVDGQPVFVRDVAEVKFGFEERASYSRLNGKESVALAVQKRVGANVIDVVDEVKRRVADRARSWPEGVEANYLSDESRDIKMMIRDLESSILSGLFLVVLVLMIFLGLRTSFFVGIAIPLSLIFTCLAVQVSGITLNMVVLMALVMAVGMLVDNAVVVVENIYRYLEEGLTPTQAAYKGTTEVGGAVAISTFTTVGAFGPLLFWPGIMGQFMRYLPLTLSIALICSLLVALTINPALCAAFLRLPPARRKGSTPSSGLGSRLRRLEARGSNLYRWVLETSLDHRGLVIAATLLLFVAVLVLFAFFNPGVLFISEGDPTQLWVDIEAPPGTNVEMTESYVQQLAAILEGVPDVEFIATLSGSGSQNDPSRPSVAGLGGSSTGEENVGRIVIELLPPEERSQDSSLTLEQVIERVQGAVPGISVEVDRKTMGPPTGEALALEIAGDDFETLGLVSAAIQREIADIPGIVSLDDDFDVARPELQILIDRTEAARVGLSTGRIGRTVRTAINGTEASTFRDQDDDIDIRVRLSKGSRSTIEGISELLITNDLGKQIRLSELATVKRGTALSSINRKDRRRLVTLSGNLESPEMANPVRAEVLRRLAEKPELLPSGYTADFGGQSLEEQQARDFLPKAFLVGIILVLALILGTFDSFWVPIIILTSVVMSLIGVLVGLLVTRQPFDIVMTGVGVISLAGIVVNNAIVLLDYAEQLRRKGMPRRELIVTAGLRRVRPVLLTALTTILGLVPLSTGYDFDFRNLVFRAGGESSAFWRPMGIAVIFGLGFATFLTLVLVPVLYDLLLARKDRQKKLDDQTPSMVLALELSEIEELVRQRREPSTV